MKAKTKARRPAKRNVKSEILDGLKLTAASIVSITILWGAAVFLRDIIISPVRAEAESEARADSLRYVGLIQSQTMMSETLAELVVVLVASDEAVRQKTLRRIQAKYEIGVVR